MHGQPGGILATLSPTINPDPGDTDWGKQGLESEYDEVRSLEMHGNAVGYTDSHAG